jgi:glycosyltransferase involved in cell wall biosynthesis
MTKEEKNVQRILGRRLRIFLAGYTRSASGYYRCCLPGAILNLHQYAHVSFRDELPQERWAEALAWADVVMLERDAQEGMLRMIKRLQSDGKAVLMDIDDDVMNFKNVPNEVVAKYWTENLPHLINNAKAVDGVTVTTKRLKKQWESITGRTVFWLPNQIDTENPRWHFPRERRNGRIVLGYMGGATHARDLEVLRPVLKIILERYPQAVFKLVGPDQMVDWIHDLPPGQVEHDPGYSPVEDYPSRMKDFDISLIPIEESQFNRNGKSDLKVLETGFLGIPIVATNFPPYSESIVHKKTGVLAKTTEEWVYWVGRLIEEPELREALGQRLKEWIIENRTIDGHAYDWYKAFYSTWLRRKGWLLQGSRK